MLNLHHRGVEQAPLGVVTLMLSATGANSETLPQLAGVTPEVRVPSAPPTLVTTLRFDDDDDDDNDDADDADDDDNHDDDSGGGGREQVKAGVMLRATFVVGHAQQSESTQQATLPLCNTQEENKELGSHLDRS